MKADIWTKSNCPYCVRAKALFDRKGVSYEEYIIGSDMNADDLKPNQHLRTREDLLAAAPNARTVPQIWLDGEHVGGYNELEAYYNKKN